MIQPETKKFIEEHLSDNPHALALQAKRYPQVDMPTAIAQIAGRQAALKKLPTWAACSEILYPPHLSMEQCSSEQTARYKAEIIQTPHSTYHSLTDLTGGFGIDCACLSTLFKEVTYVERQEILCQLAAHNFPLLGLKHITIRNSDAIDHLQQMRTADWIFIDPARRNTQGAKTVAISDCEPNVSAIEELLLQKSQHVLVKLSPMLDLSLALNELKYVQAAHIVSAGGECKELLLILGKETIKEIPIYCINLLPNQKRQCFCFTRQQEQESLCKYASSPENYLYEPNASLLKAGAFRSLAHQYGIKKLHPNSHLYTSTRLIEDFPGRKFRITESCGFGKKEVKQLTDGAKKANLTIRNFPASVSELRKRLKIEEGGEIYLFATTLSPNEKRLIRCQKV